MKAVLISIKPKWCNLIANGKKTFEIRKTKPKIETPFKCYIYCTKPKSKFDFGLCIDNESFGLIAKCNYNYAQEHEMPILSGKVIGEFICDGIITGCTKDIYGWHISDLKIYYEPNEVTEFYKACNKPQFYDCTKCTEHDEQSCFALERPPQSWCYVEELEEEK